MMHKNGFVLAIKHNGKVLREIDGSVFLPFNSEYSIFMKNTSSLRGVVKIEIDGSDISNQKEFIIPANGHIEIERFIVDGIYECGKTFKFVRTSNPSVSDPTNPENGKVKATFWREYQPPPAVYLPYYYYPYYYYPHYITYTTLTGEIPFIDNSTYTVTSDSILYSTINDPNPQATPVECYNSVMNFQVEESGATIAGSQSKQLFVEAGYFPKDFNTETAICITLKGTKGPVTVKDKTYCHKCGVKQPRNAIYCFNCGTYLVR